MVHLETYPARRAATLILSYGGFSSSFTSLQCLTTLAHRTTVLFFFFGGSVPGSWDHWNASSVYGGLLASATTRLSRFGTRFLRLS